MFHDMMIALIRTFVPAAIGSAIAWGIDQGIAIPEDTQTQLTAALVTVCITVYYALVTLLERKVNPAFGWLLGAPKAPTYDPPASVDPVDATPSDIPADEMNDEDPVAESATEYGDAGSIDPHLPPDNVEQNEKGDTNA